jgi:DNA-binding transcriptional regulator YdaS (Cro superfamily)
MNSIKAINRLVVYFGGQYRLANALDVSSSAVSMWIKDGALPPMRAIQVERITDGKFKARDLVGE